MKATILFPMMATGYLGPRKVDVRLHYYQFQACPTSSVYTNSNRFEDHALQVFAKDGVSFSLNTDDPGVIDCDLTGEYQVAEERIGLTQHQIMRSVSLATHCIIIMYSHYFDYNRCYLELRQHFYQQMKRQSWSKQSKKN